VNLALGDDCPLNVTESKFPCALRVTKRGSFGNCRTFDDRPIRQSSITAQFQRPQRNLAPIEQLHDFHPRLSLNHERYAIIPLCFMTGGTGCSSIHFLKSCFSSRPVIEPHKSEDGNFPLSFLRLFHEQRREKALIGQSVVREPISFQALLFGIPISFLRVLSHRFFPSAASSLLEFVIRKAQSPINLPRRQSAFDIVFYSLILRGQNPQCK
jgi:hypothetical protein